MADRPRIVSLLPSATEIAALVGAGEQIVGRSHECDFPDGLDQVPVLTSQRTTMTNSADIDQQVRDAATGDATSLYTVDAAQLVELRPDVILTQDLCDVCSIDLATVRGIAAQMDPSPRIVSLNPVTLDDVLDDVLTVGDAVGRTDDAHHAAIALRGKYWTAVDHVNGYIDGPEVAFLEWMDPLFCGGHWTPQLIRDAGGRHSLNEAGAKSRAIKPEDLIEIMPARLIVCPCGYDLAAIEREQATLTESRWWNMLPAVQDGNVVMVDGSAMFNRPGPRLFDAFRWLTGWLNDRPELIPDDFPVGPFPAE